MDDWRGKKHDDEGLQNPALQDAKLEDLMQGEPKNESGHDLPFGDLFIH
jgi:hypothetical protein